MNARDEILSRIRKSLGGGGSAEHGRDAAAHGADSAVSTVSGQPPDEVAAECDTGRAKLIERFASALLRVGGRFTAAAGPEALRQAIDRIVSAAGARKILGSDSRLLEKLGLASHFAERGIDFRTANHGDKEALIEEAASAAIGITAVDYALADSGTLVLLANRSQPRTISLLPPIHIAILEPQQIVRGLDDLFALLPPDRRQVSSAITLITGPSRTADIELTLVVGVHGPQELHVVMYGGA